MDDLCEVRLRPLLLPSLALAPIPKMWMDDLGEKILKKKEDIESSFFRAYPGR